MARAKRWALRRKMSRREFAKLLSASAVVAGVGAGGSTLAGGFAGKLERMPGAEGDAIRVFIRRPVKAGVPFPVGISVRQLAGQQWVEVYAEDEETGEVTHLSRFDLADGVEQQFTSILLKLVLHRSATLVVRDRSGHSERFPIKVEG